ncbi:MAG: serine/threonine protein kinase, partial [Planctomycetota bacterium]
LESVSVAATLVGSSISYLAGSTVMEGLSQVGSWKILKKLGQGGMGVVYLGEHIETRKKGAVKILPAAFSQDEKVRSRFLREAKATQKINHPNVARIYEYGVERGHVYMVMEYIEGEDLLNRIKDGPLPLEQGLSILIGSLRGLQAAHNAGVIHWDIKPQNIMLTKEGEAKLVDFGLARLSFIILGGF